MPTSTPNRRSDIDALRAVAVLLLIVFHTARLFDAEPWHIKDLTAPYWSADFIVRLLNIWQMPVLFLLAGMSAAWALERRSAGAFVRERAQRLIVPLLIGMIVFAAPQVYIERISPDVPLRMSPIDFDGGPIAFMGTYFKCCYPGANLSWHHLWFLPYLFFYSLLLVPLAHRNTATGMADWLAASPWRLALPGLWLLAVELALRPTFPSTHALIDDWANHAHYASLVVIGWWIARNPDLEAAVARVGPAAAGIAISATIAWLATISPDYGGFGLIDLPWALRLTLRTTAEWASLLALLAIARGWLDRPIPGLRTFAALALAFYILHQTLIVLLGWVFLDWIGQPLAKAIVVAAIAAVGSLALAALGAQTVATRIMLGLRTGDRSRTTPSTASAPSTTGGNS